MSLPTYTFNSGIPNAGNNPSSDQPIMLSNNQATQSIMEVDHVGFNNEGSGYHQQVRMQSYDSLSLTPPPSTIANFGGVYCNSAGSVGASTETNLWYSPDASGNTYQLTRTITGNFDTFGQNIPYGSPPSGYTQIGGWVFLSGGILMQYGFFGKANGTGAFQVEFPVVFLNPPYSIQLTAYASSRDLYVALNSNYTPSTTSFYGLATANIDGVYWTAIGV